MKLTDTQLILLTEAAKRSDRAVVLPDRLKGGAATRVTDKLIAAGLIEEVRPSGGLPVVRREEDGAPLALRITAEGLKAINAEEDAGADKVATGQATEAVGGAKRVGSARGRGGAAKADAKGAASKIRGNKEDRRAPDGKRPRATNEASGPKAAQLAGVGKGTTASGAGTEHAAPREGSKAALVLEMLRRREGATLDELIAATGWLPHTTRAALTGLRKRGHVVERGEGRRGKETRTVYRIGHA